MRVFSYSSVAITVASAVLTGDLVFAQPPGTPCGPNGPVVPACPGQGGGPSPTARRPNPSPNPRPSPSNNNDSDKPDVIEVIGFDAAEFSTSAKDNNPQFTTLLASLDAALLTTALDASNGKAHTIFAPTNSAFAALDGSFQGIIECLLKKENKDVLQKILKYHVAMGYFYAEDLTNNKSIKTLDNNRTVRIRKKDAVSKTEVNDSTVLLVDITASNGVVHAIDAVLNPGLNIKNFYNDKCR